MLNGAGNRTIAQYVRRGGAYLGFCAGGYYGSGRCEFEVGNPPLEVVGSRELAFFPGTCRGGAFKGFEYHSEKGAKAAKISVSKGAFDDSESLPDEFRCYYNGGGVFVDAEKLASDSSKVEILAEYTEDIDVESGAAKAAIVYCKVGEGCAILTGPHPEYVPPPCLSSHLPASTNTGRFDAVNLSQQSGVPGYEELIEALKADEESRASFLKACLSKLGLEVSQSAVPVPSLSKIHLSSLRHTEVGELLSSLNEIITKDGEEEYIKGSNDLFHLEKPDSRWSMTALSEALSNDFAASQKKTGRGSPDPTADYTHVIKRVVAHEGAWPEPKETPYFNHAVYYSSLREFRDKDEEAETWGDTLMYGEVLTSTNTLLEK